MSGDCECSMTTVGSPTGRAACDADDVPQDNGLEGTYHPLGTRARHVQDERRRRLREAAVAAQRERALAAQCTFAPAITPDLREGGGDDGEMGTVFERLARAAARRANRLAELAAEKQRADALETSDSFRPSINAQHPIYRDDRLAFLRTVPVEERLLHYGKSVALSQQVQQTLQAAATEPTARRRGKDGVSDAAARQAAQRAFEERNATLLQRRLQKRVAAEQAAMQGLTFHPQLAASSLALERARHVADASHSARTPSRTTRLYESGLQTVRQRARASCDATPSNHHPHTNPQSEAWILRSGHRRLFVHDFLHRQELYQRIHDENVSLIKAEQEAERCATSPLALPPRVSAAMIEEQVQRLYPDPRDRSTTHSTHTTPDCTFAPTLSPGTRHVVRRMAHRERDVVRRLTQHHTTVTTDTTTATTAAPEKSAATVRVDDAEAVYRRHTAAARRREARLRAQRAELDVQEMLPCTFRPRINARHVDCAAPRSAREDDHMAVAGVEEFLRRQAEARQRQADAEQRLREVGKGMPVNGPGYTVFTPFHLHTTAVHENRVWSALAKDDDDVAAVTPGCREVRDDGECAELSDVAPHSTKRAPAMAFLRLSLHP